MTKSDVFTALGGGDHVADLHLLFTHDDTINHQFNQLAFLLKCGFGQPLLDALTKRLNRLHDGGQFIVMPHARFELTDLPS